MDALVAPRVSDLQFKAMLTVYKQSIGTYRRTFALGVCLLVWC